jgi:polar amino acid transport system substrate-binding protein
MTEIEAAYVVHQSSTLKSTEEVDAKGMKIAAAAKAGYELYLTSALKNASIVQTKNFADSIQIFNDHQVDAIAGLKPNLIESMHKLPEGKLLQGKFMTVNHGFAIALGKAAANVYLQNFVNELIETGFVARSIEKHQIKGLKAIGA